MCVCGFVPIPEDNLRELVLTFYHVDSGHRIQLVRLGGKYFYLLSHLVDPFAYFSGVELCIICLVVIAYFLVHAIFTTYILVLNHPLPWDLYLVLCENSHQNSLLYLHSELITSKIQMILMLSSKKYKTK